MKKQIHKIVLFLFVLVLVLWGVTVNDNGQGLKEAGLQEKYIGSMQVHFLDVGQGDSIYVRTPDELDILIDGGPDKTVLSELGAVMPYWDRDIDIMILTHPHSDHVTGLVEVLRRYNVKQIYYTGALHTASDYLAWLEEIKEQEIPLSIVSNRFNIDLGEEINLEFLWPLENLANKKVTELNNTSIMNKLVFGEVSFLFTGDNEAEVEAELIERGVDLKADVLKSSHHGSKTSNTEEFINLVDPESVVIQCGEDNSFHHPHGRVLNRYERSNRNIFRTDLDGRVSFITNGFEIEKIQ
jgi:competence protein ComEC